MANRKAIVLSGGETAHAAARKKRAAPVMSEPEMVEAHWRRYMPKAASESPQRLPRTRTGPQFVFCGVSDIVPSGCRILGEIPPPIYGDCRDASMRRHRAHVRIIGGVLAPHPVDQCGGWT